MTARAILAALLLVALPASAEDFSRAEVSAFFGDQVDEYRPAADLGLPYRDDVVAVSWALTQRSIRTATGSWVKAGMLLTALFDGEGNLLAARSQKLGDLGAPVYDVTESLKKILRGRRA